MVSVVKMTTLDEYNTLVKVAAQDNHNHVWFPTHLIYKDNTIIGYLSISQTVICWIDSKRGTARDTIETIGIVDAILNDRGIKQWMIPCQHNSPYFNHMEKLGFKPMGVNTLFIRSI